MRYWASVWVRALWHVAFRSPMLPLLTAIVLDANGYHTAALVLDAVTAVVIVYCIRREYRRSRELLRKRRRRRP